MAATIVAQELDSITYSLEPIWPSAVRPLRLAVPEEDEDEGVEEGYLTTDSDSSEARGNTLRRWLRCGRNSESRSTLSSELRRRQQYSDTVLGRLRRRLAGGCFEIESTPSVLACIDGPRPSVEVAVAAPPPSLFTMNDAQNYVEVAFMYLNRGDMGAAEKNVRTAIHIADKNNVSPRSRADLLTVLAIATGAQDCSSERNLAKALAIYKKDPPTGNFGEIALRSLLAVLCRQGRFDESVEVAARYRQFIPRNKPKQTFQLRRAK